MGRSRHREKYFAKIIASSCGMEYHYLSAVSSGVADVRKVIAEGEKNKRLGGRLFSSLMKFTDSIKLSRMLYWVQLRQGT
jgi:replication-associated recombination protein RarA